MKVKFIVVVPVCVYYSRVIDKKLTELTLSLSYGYVLKGGTENLAGDDIGDDFST